MNGNKMPNNMGNTTYKDEFVKYDVEKPRIATQEPTYHPSKEGFAEKESRYKSDFRPYE